MMAGLQLVNEKLLSSVVSQLLGLRKQERTMVNDRNQIKRKAARLFTQLGKGSCCQCKATFQEVFQQRRWV